MFVRRLVQSAKIDVGEYTYDDSDDDRLTFERDAMLYGFGPHQDVARLLRSAWWDWPIEVVTEQLPTLTTGTAAAPEAIAAERGLVAA